MTKQNGNLYNDDYLRQGSFTNATWIAVVVGVAIVAGAIMPYVLVS